MVLDVYVEGGLAPSQKGRVRGVFRVRGRWRVLRCGVFYDRGRLGVHAGAILVGTSWFLHYILQESFKVLSNSLFTVSILNCIRL